MNEYTMKINECPTTVEQIESLSELMDKAYALSRDCFINAQRINQHLFGIGIKQNEDSSCCPQCFRDVLAMQTETLKELNDELIRIGQKLGV